jgi:hypothetical protein
MLGMIEVCNGSFADTPSYLIVGKYPEVGAKKEMRRRLQTASDPTRSARQTILVAVVFFALFVLFCLAVVIWQ